MDSLSKLSRRAYGLVQLCRDGARLKPGVMPTEAAPEEMNRTGSFRRLVALSHGQTTDEYQATPKWLSTRLALFY